MPDAPALPSTTNLPSRTDDDALDEIRAWVLAQFGLRFGAAQASSFRSRVLFFCSTHRMTTAEAISLLRQRDPTLVRELAEVVSTHHTSFFREPEMFAYFSSTITTSLPESGPLRFWSAASSSGEEAYSIAFCLRHALGAAARQRVKILGTDISAHSIAQAEEGSYVRALLDATSPQISALLEPTSPTALSVPADVKELCTFRRMNLTKMPWPFGQRFHVIFLRNVLFYFEPLMQQRILESCYDFAETNAWLITSLTEPLLDIKTRWTRHCPGVHRKVV